MCEVSDSVCRGAALNCMLFCILHGPAFTEHEQLRHQLLTWPKMHNFQIVFSLEYMLC